MRMFAGTILLLMGCAPPPPAGDYCDIAKPDRYASEDVVRYLVEHDPEHLKRDIAENEYGKRNCPEGWFDSRYLRKEMLGPNDLGSGESDVGEEVQLASMAG